MQIPELMRSFKHHFHKTRKVIKSKINNCSFKISIYPADNTIDEEFFTPDNPETVQFIVLMERFLNSNSNLHYKTIWTLLIDNFADAISSETKLTVERFSKKLSEGDIGICINNENLSSERIYHILSTGEYFGNNIKAQNYLQTLKGIPILGSIFWYRFYTYTMDAYFLVQLLFKAIIQIEKSNGFIGSFNNSAQGNTQCVYCLSKSGNFTSEEHIFPESLGNNELILKKGFVCDDCNNGILSRLDDFLLKFEPIAFLQVLFVHYKKNGKLPYANFQNFSAKRISPKNIFFKLKNKSALTIDNINPKTGEVSFSTHIIGKRFDAKMLGRALYKISLGMVAFDQGHEIACNPKYNNARDFIMNGQIFSNNILIQKKFIPHPIIEVIHNKLLEGTPFAIDIFGLTFLLNLENQPFFKFNKLVTQEHFISISLEN